MSEESIRTELDALKADIGQLREDIGALTNAVKNVAGEKIDDTRTRARESAQDAWEDIERKLDDVLQQGRSTVDNIEEEIGQHPGGSLLTAFGLGFIIARLIDSGGRR